MTDERLGDKPIDPAFLAQMDLLAREIDQLFNNGLHGKHRKVGFILMVYPFGVSGENHRCNYISNSNRSDVVNLLREQLARFEGQSDMKGSA